MKLINNSKSSMVKFYLNVTRRRGRGEIFSFDFQNLTKLSEILLINLKNDFVCVFGWGQNILGRKDKISVC